MADKKAALKDGAAGLGGDLDDVGGAVIADMGVEGGGRGEGRLGVTLGHLLVGLDPGNAFLVQKARGGGE